MRLLGHDLFSRRLLQRVAHEAGVWEERLHRTPLLDRLGQADEEIDWERASLDSAAVAAPGGAKRRPARTRRTKANRAPRAILWSTERVSRCR